MNTPNDWINLRQCIEQEINSIAIGTHKNELPGTLGVLIPSLDLQKTINRIEVHILKEWIIELENFSDWINKGLAGTYRVNRLDDLTKQLKDLEDK